MKLKLQANQYYKFYYVCGKFTLNLKNTGRAVKITKQIKKKNKFKIQ